MVDVGLVDLYILFISFMPLPRVFGAESSSNSGGVASDQVGLKNTYGSVSAGREKWPFNVLFFLKSRASV